ncbi:MAG: L,D-transpeptidase [Caldilineaceae bacterium]|nr:L,D-transpeptidase [Caldilineaceae bacterium]
MRILFVCLSVVTLWLMATPVLYAAPGLILEANGLTIPSGDIAQGTVDLTGIAQHPTFRKWQIDLQLNGDPALTTFVAVGEEEQPHLATFAKLDTTLYPNGNHLLRLRVVHSNLNYDEYFTPITIRNAGLPVPPETDLAPTTENSASFVPITPLGTGVAEGERWIEVDISDQLLTAWQGDTVVLRTRVSTGRAEYPTVTGTWPIRTKLTSTRMIGPGYDTPDVPWTMYFFRGYAVHGAYWHNNFGTPVSHGCINMRPDEAKLLFDWASVGTNVTVHE